MKLGLLPRTNEIHSFSYYRHVVVLENRQGWRRTKSWRLWQAMPISTTVYFMPGLLLKLPQKEQVATSTRMVWFIESANVSTTAGGVSLCTRSSPNNFSVLSKQSSMLSNCSPSPSSTSPARPSRICAQNWFCGFHRRVFDGSKQRGNYHRQND